MIADHKQIPATSGLKTFVREFVDHPASVDETYWGHAFFALGFAGQLALAALAALLHAVAPPLCTTTASRIVKRLHDRLEARH